MTCHIIPSHIIIFIASLTLMYHFVFSFHCMIHIHHTFLPTPAFLPRESCGQQSLVGCCLWGRTESDMTEVTSMHACIGEGNGNPLQYSCLENPRDSGAGWAAVYGVAQSWTRLKRLSSSSSGIVDSWRGLGACLELLVQDWIHKVNTQKVSTRYGLIC